MSVDLPHLRVLNPSPPATLILSCIDILHTILPPLPVLDCLSTWTRLHYRRPPLPVSALAVLPPSTCSPGPCRPLQPRVASPFLPPLPTSGCLPFAALDVESSTTVNPCGFALLGSVLLPTFPEPPPPPASLGLRPGPCRSQGESCLQFLASCPPLPWYLTR